MCGGTFRSAASAEFERYSSRSVSPQIEPKSKPCHLLVAVLSLEVASGTCCRPAVQEVGILGGEQ